MEFTLKEAISCALFGLVSKRAAIMNTSPIDHYMPFKDYLRSDLFPYDGYNLQPLQKYKVIQWKVSNF